VAKNNIHILFLGGAKRVSMGEHFIHAGKSLKKKVKLFSYELDKTVPISSIGSIIKGLRWNDKNIISHLTRIIAHHKIDIVIPFVDPSTIISSELSTRKIGKVFFPVCRPSECSVFFDKIRANDWFIKNGFPVPVQTTSYPVIAKPRYGSASMGITVLKNGAEYNIFTQQHSPADYLFQRFITATEYSVDCYVSPVTKKIISIIPRKRIETIGGEVTKTLTVKHKKIIDLSTELLQKAGLVGPVTIQFLEDIKSNDIYVMEINPRFGGGAPASITAGANMPLYILNDYLKKENIPLKKWNHNLLMVRAFREFYI
jgi:carbamoyl-phosphate synthase large subunit